MINHNFKFQKDKLSSRRLQGTLALILFIFPIILIVPGWAYAEAVAITINGEGVANSLTLTRQELEAMEQYEHLYSVINTWPTKRWYAARGVKLRELLNLAGIKEEATLIKFISSDGYEITLTVKELLKDQRYYFPGLQENHPTDGSIPGSAEGAEEVEPILALVSAEGSKDFAAMNERDAPLLVLGQRAVTEQTNQLFLKHVSQIQVLTIQPEKWDSPKANIPSETVVPVGTEIILSNKNNDADKIYYTTDGSTPTINSPIFNWSASRWWDQRGDAKAVNKPIEVKEDTIIKMITIGPGKLDSDVVTFKFTADMTGKAVDPTKVPGGPPTQITLDPSAINGPVGSAHQLEVIIEPFNATNQEVIWRSSDTRIATVDSRGLVTVVGPGTAIISATTKVGSLTAICIVNGPEEDQDSQDITPVINVTAGNQPPEPQPELPAKELEPETLLTASPGEPVTPAPPVPENRAQYLAKIEELAPSSITDPNLSPPGNEVWQVFAMSADTIPLPLQVAQERMKAYAALMLLFFLFLGVGNRYAQYVKER
jgi:hypothetical protein